MMDGYATANDIGCGPSHQLATDDWLQTSGSSCRLAELNTPSASTQLIHPAAASSNLAEHVFSGGLEMPGIHVWDGSNEGSTRSRTWGRGVYMHISC